MGDNSNIENFQRNMFGLIRSNLVNLVTSFWRPGMASLYELNKISDFGSVPVIIENGCDFPWGRNKATPAISLTRGFSEVQL